MTGIHNTSESTARAWLGQKARQATAYRRSPPPPFPKKKKRVRLFRTLEEDLFASSVQLSQDNKVPVALGHGSDRLQPRRHCLPYMNRYHDHISHSANHHDQVNDKGKIERTKTK